KNIHRFPDSKEADEWGVMPDENYAVQFTDPEMRSYADYRKQRDVLSKDGPPKSEFVDRQLVKAEEFVIEKLAGEKKPDSTAKADATKPPEKAPEKSPEQSPERSSEKSSEKNPETKNPKGSKSEASARETLRRLRELPRQMAAYPSLAA